MTIIKITPACVQLHTKTVYIKEYRKSCYSGSYVPYVGLMVKLLSNVTSSFSYSIEKPIAWKASINSSSSYVSYYHTFECLVINSHNYLALLILMTFS